MDMSKFIIAKSDQLNADDLLGGPRVVTITGVRGTDASDQPVAVSYVDDGGKPYKPCKSMRRVMVHCWGKDARTYVGKSMELYCDPDVQFGGMKVGGIRIGKMSHIEAKKSMALTATRGKKGLFTVQPLQVERSDPPGSIVTVEEFQRRLQSAAEQGTAALEAAWKDRNMAPLREHINDLDALKQRAAAADSFSQPDQPQQTGADYDGV